MKMPKRLLTAIIIIIISIAFESLMYELGRAFSHSPTLLVSSIDDKIPFLAGFIYPYISWYLMLFFVPIIIHKYSKADFCNYITTTIITIIIAFCIFIIFPTTVNRPNIVGINFTSNITYLIFKMDEPVLCCLPSMHCVLCFLFIIYTIKLKGLKSPFKVIITLWSSLVILSTLFIKQHVIYDILGAIIVVYLAYIICKKFNLSKYITCLYDKLYVKLSKD